MEECKGCARYNESFRGFPCEVFSEEIFHCNKKDIYDKLETELEILLYVVRKLKKNKGPKERDSLYKYMNEFIDWWVNR